MALLGGLIAVIGGGLVKTFSVETAKFLATRAMLYSLFTLILPVILYNVYIRIVQEVLDYAMSSVSGAGLSSQIVGLTSMGAWIADRIMLPQSMSLFLSVLALKFTLSIILRR